MIWLLILFLPVLLLLYVCYLLIKAIFIVIWAALYVLFGRTEMGEIDPATDRVKWS